jgi:predicted nucleic acid-binding protein
VYLDSSAFLRWLLGSKQIIKGFLKWKECYSSELLWIEVNRVLNRLRLESEITDEEFGILYNDFSEFYKSIYVIEMSALVKEKASGIFPTVIGTLDALHLASAMLLQSEKKEKQIILFTHDKQLATGAIAMGIETMGVR